MKRNIGDLVGTKISHKKYGECQVVEVTDIENFKFKGRIVETGEVKQFVFSTQFFNVDGDYESASINLTSKPHKDRHYKPVDYSKYRNHPLVKEIDRREAGLRVTVPKLEVKEDIEDNLES